MPGERQSARSQAEKCAQRRGQGAVAGHPQPPATLQGAIGNRAMARLLAMPAGRVSRLVEYNDQVVGGRFTDPEQAAGILPFNDKGWDGLEIARKLSQLDTAVSSDDSVRCDETSFLVALVQRGPDAVRSMVENYLGRYRVGLARAGTPERIKRWYRRAVRNLAPLLAKFDAKTLTYGDLSTIMTEMFRVYGETSTDASGAQDKGTFTNVEQNMAAREGYKVSAINQDKVTREQAAALAKALQPGEFLSCMVECSRQGTQQVNHYVQIGRHPGLGKLYFYDPWPVRGDQMLLCDDDLTQVEHYFTNPVEQEIDVGHLGRDALDLIRHHFPGMIRGKEGEGLKLDTGIRILRSFFVHAKYTPPSGAGASPS